MRAAEDRQPDHVGVLVASGCDDLLRRQANAAVDDLHPGVACGDGDLLSAVAVAIETRLGDEEAWGAAGHGLHELGDRGQLADAPADGRAHPRGRTELAEHGAQRARPFAGRAPGLGEGDRRLHDVRPVHRGIVECGDRRVDCHLVPTGSPRDDIGDQFVLHRRVHGEDVARRVERRALGLGEPVHAHDDLVAGFDAAGTFGHRTDQTSLQLVDGGKGTAEGKDLLELGPRGGGELGGLGLDHGRPVEQIVVLQKVGLEREHLLHA